MFYEQYLKLCPGQPAFARPNPGHDHELCQWF